MRSIKLFAHFVFFSLLPLGAFARASSFSGTVTDKTTGKPDAGDPVVLVDVQTDMSEVAHTITDSRGRYSLNGPGAGPYLIRTTHQGVGYFIAAPQGGASGGIPVYDVAAKVEGVSIEADIFEVESSDNGQLHIAERFFVHNTSSPPRTEWSPRNFAVILPPDAAVAGVAAERPTGLPTTIKLDANGPKGHYTFNFPIQPDEGDKDTLFQIEYTVPYGGGAYTFRPQVSLPAQSIGVLLPKSMTFASGSNSGFQSVQGDTNVLTFLARNVAPDQALSFTVSGTGSMPREKQSDDGQSASDAGGQPGGGIGEPINTPDPLSKYKGWILSALALLLAATAAFLLRKPTGTLSEAAPGATMDTGAPSASASEATVKDPAALLSALKEELFALEIDKLNGKLKPEDYAEAKAALEVVLKRTVKSQVEH